MGGTPSASDIVGSISAEPEQDLDAITITSIGTDPIETSAIVTAVVEGYGDLISEGVQTAATDSIEQLEIAKAGLTERVAELDALVAENPDDSALQAEQRAAVDQLYAVDQRHLSAGRFGRKLRLLAGKLERARRIVRRPRAQVHSGRRAVVLQGARRFEEVFDYRRRLRG